MYEGNTAVSVVSFFPSSKTCYERIFNLWYYRAIDMYIHLSVIYVFVFDFTERYFQYQRTYHATKPDNIGQHDVKYIMALPKKTSKVSFKYLDIHYH
jgi:hypothetical protein